MAYRVHLGRRLRGVWLPPRPACAGTFYFVRSSRAIVSRMRAWPFVFFAAPVFAQCSTTPTAPPVDPNAYLAGEQRCTSDDNPIPRRITFDPPSIVLAPGASRPVRMFIDPDFCQKQTIPITSANADIVQPPQPATLDRRHASYDFVVVAGPQKDAASHTTKLTATMFDTFQKVPLSADLPIDVRGADPQKCTNESTQTPLDATHLAASGAGALKNASVGAPAIAFTRTDVLGLPAFSATVACDGADLTSDVQNLIKLGPAVSFSAGAPLNSNQPLRREIDFAIPINPAALPSMGRLRHLVMLFRSPMAKTARPVTIANPHIESTSDGDYVLKFQSPWFGTYQASMAPDAGTRKHMRHLTHRAVIGFSMGGGGAATFGVRHHDQFDAVAPMGGPSDWTWLLSFVENYALGGFCPVGSVNCVIPSPDKYPMLGETFAHTMDFNHWWYEKGGGNGGHFPRAEYVQIFEDLSLMRGNPNGQNAALPWFASGPQPSDPWVVGDPTGLPPGTDCSLTVDPIKDDANCSPCLNKTQDQIQRQCNKSRCDPSRVYKVTKGYYDDEYNPDGSQQVISICDGAEVGESASPYSNTWVAPNADQAFPMSLTLAVDLNKNGVRDQNEPVIRSGHEPWDDAGIDGLFDKSEPGYDPITNPDPNQDDYSYQVNPTGTEGNHHYEVGEPFKDYGLDGVPNTASSPYDFGEGDGKYNQSSGLDGFLKVDPHALIRGWSNDTPGGVLDDNAFSRLDLWSDGGVRDLFNFAAVANHFTGAIATRTRKDGSAIHPTVFYNNFTWLPGEDPTRPNDFVPSKIRWADVADAPSVRYGNVDATPAEIDAGDGQHVGTALQLLNRLTGSFYFVAHRWTDGDRVLTEPSSTTPETTTQNELGITCELTGRCEKIFTGPKTKRTGPIAVTLPPGYANEDVRLRNVRYPVVYVLHGYGQDPRDLEAVALISNNFMNDANRSYVSRLPKFIVVYVDGRCRIGQNGKPECIRGTFYLNSQRKDGPQLDDWFDEVLDYVDTNYRTLPAADVEVVE